MSPFAKPRIRPYRSLLAALVILVVTLSAGSTALAQVPRNPPPAESASEPGQPPEGKPARGVSVEGREVEDFMDEYFARQLE